MEPSKTTAKVIADSRGEDGWSRLVTVEATFARSALSELNTHRAFSRNSASSRAIPVAKMLKKVEEEPFIPRAFSMNQSGMHSSEFVTPWDAAWDEVVGWWLDSRDQAVRSARRGLEMGLHKQDVNRILEPYMMHTAIISATEWDNFFKLRLATDDDGNPLAYLPIYDLALEIKEAISNSVMTLVPDLGWHTPYILPQDEERLEPDDQLKVSVARCARVSYLNQDKQMDYQKDFDLYDRLLTNGHLSPMEHVATPDSNRSSNFIGWRQLRTDLVG